jgi:putative copper export protein
VLDTPDPLPAAPLLRRSRAPRRAAGRGAYVIRRTDGAYAAVRMVPVEPVPLVLDDVDEEAGPSVLAALVGLAVAVGWAALVLVALRWPHAARTTGDVGAAIDTTVWRTLLADRVMAVAGWLGTATCLFTLGAALFHSFVYRPLATGTPASPWSQAAGWDLARQAAAVRSAAVVGVLATGAAVLLRAVEESAGSVSIGLTRIGFVATTPFGVAALARVAGLTWLAASPEGGRLGSLGGVAVLASFVVVGHPQATPTSSTALDGALLAAQVVHVLVVAAWFGGICCLVLDLRQRRRRGDPQGSAAVIGRFSTIAGLAVVTATATGLALAWSQLPSVTAAPGTAYGRALLAKLGCVAVVVAIGGYNRQRLVPAVERHHRDDERAWHALRRTLVAEALIIGCGVLVATAAMTSGGFTR